MNTIPLSGLDDSVQILTGTTAQRDELLSCSPLDNGFRPCSGSAAEIRRRIGAALRVNPEYVELERTELDASASAIRCVGRMHPKKFFAKIYLVDRLPIPSPFPIPGEDLGRQEEDDSPIEDYILTEWKRVNQIRSLVGSRNCPVPLGYTLEGRTLVFERMSGMRADCLAHRIWPWTARLKSAEKALFHAGAWLRNLHQSFCYKFESVFPIEVLEQGHRLAKLKPAESDDNRRLSLQPLEAVCRRIGPRTPVRTPISMNQGYYSLQNLLWDGEREHLWVTDFGHASYRPILHDLCTIVCDLRTRLLNPLSSPWGLRRIEDSFWAGYGSVAANLQLLVDAVATHRILDQGFPLTSGLYSGQGFRGRIQSLVYKRFLQPCMISRILVTH
jgi:hypothetical protein